MNPKTFTTAFTCPAMVRRTAESRQMLAQHTREREGFNLTGGPSCLQHCENRKLCEKGNLMERKYQNAQEHLLNLSDLWCQDRWRLLAFQFEDFFKLKLDHLSISSLCLLSPFEQLGVARRRTSNNPNVGTKNKECDPYLRLISLSLWSISSECSSGFSSFSLLSSSSAIALFVSSSSLMSWWFWCRRDRASTVAVRRPKAKKAVKASRFACGFMILTADSLVSWGMSKNFWDYRLSRSDPLGSRIFLELSENRLSRPVLFTHPRSVPASGSRSGARGVEGSCRHAWEENKASIESWPVFRGLTFDWRRRAAAAKVNGGSRADSPFGAQIILLYGGGRLGIEAKKFGRWWQPWKSSVTFQKLQLTTTSTENEKSCKNFGQKGKAYTAGSFCCYVILCDKWSWIICCFVCVEIWYKHNLDIRKKRQAWAEGWTLQSTPVELDMMVQVKDQWEQQGSVLGWLYKKKTGDRF